MSARERPRVAGETRMKGDIAIRIVQQERSHSTEPAISTLHRGWSHHRNISFLSTKQPIKVSRHAIRLDLMPVDGPLTTMDNTQNACYSDHTYTQSGPSRSW